ncbi:MAG: hypothetical protein A2Z07_08125 [Armatimonadetes bacterium RBG_16_67_12]|nr:MAG: hypothetical protein A2Z07_08125 [Armatimonadetes bacterium RBG_16_67_12]
MRSIWVGLLVLVVLGTAGLGWWIGWGRFTAGPPEAVVGAFLRAAQAGNWGTAQAYMTRHMQGRLAREGFGAMRGFLATRLEPFATFEIIQVTPRGDEIDVVVRLMRPAKPDEIGSPPPQPGTHGGGRIVDGAFVHAHRFQLQQEGQAWRVYQFEEVDAGI